MNHFRLLIVVVTSLWLAACASPSKQECQEMPWTQMGRELGEQGKITEPKIKEMNKACNDQHGVPVDMASFMNGYNLGLGKFCSFEKGKRQGEEGQEFFAPMVCEGKKEGLMKDGYKVGLASYCKPERFEADGAEGKSFSYNELCDPKEKIKANRHYLKGLAGHCKKRFIAMGKEGAPFEMSGVCSDQKKTSLYKQYYSRGNVMFCTSKRGYEVGLAGGEYRFVCKDKLEFEFLKGYNLGAQQKAQNDIAKLKKNLEYLEAENRRKQRLIDRLSAEVSDLESDVSGLESELSDKESEISDLRSQIQ